ncbi:hypothetical protein QBC44DRAFT_370406 [Cladorrhinum sp. PSN332]|nr:hypothetical protein QBC44DRAFT_370406 [Cladorrhinum sp. PSN332]
MTSLNAFQPPEFYGSLSFFLPLLFWPYIPGDRLVLNTALISIAHGFVFAINGLFALKDSSPSVQFPLWVYALWVFNIFGLCGCRLSLTKAGGGGSGSGDVRLSKREWRRRREDIDDWGYVFTMTCVVFLVSSWFGVGYVYRGMERRWSNVVIRTPALSALLLALLYHVLHFTPDLLFALATRRVELWWWIVDLERTDDGREGWEEKTPAWSVALSKLQLALVAVLLGLMMYFADGRTEALAA